MNRLVLLEGKIGGENWRLTAYAMQNNTEKFGVIEEIERTDSDGRKYWHQDGEKYGLHNVNMGHLVELKIIKLLHDAALAAESQTPLISPKLEESLNKQTNNCYRSELHGSMG